MSPKWSLTRAKTEQWGFKKQWRSAHYHTGDIYQDNLQSSQRKKWETKESEGGPYLQYLKIVSSEWPQLRPLVDFMEVGTDPLRWRNFHGDDKSNVYTYPDEPRARKDKQLDRVSKTRVRQLAYRGENVSLIGNYNTPQDLDDALAVLSDRKNDAAINGAPTEFRLFVVEDLSREVIEKLGYHFNVDPDFFRAHIFDYAWFNIRDPFWNPPSLHVDTLAKDWFQLRFSRARYFSSRPCFNTGQEAVNLFNIGRKLYEDENKSYWERDIPRKSRKAEPARGLKKKRFTTLSQSESKKKKPDEETPPAGSGGPLNSEEPADPNTDGQQAEEEEIDGKVGLMRTNATFWRKRWEEGNCDIGILLLDPTIEEGFPLWRGYRNWSPVPPVPSAQCTQANFKSSMADSCVPSLTRTKSESPTEASFFEDFMFWAQRPEAVFAHSQTTISDGQCTPVFALLRLVCAEWLTMSQYIKTRLCQVDWEITHPKEFLTQTKIDSILKKLHTWRRLVPTYREMLVDTTSRVFQRLDRTDQSGPGVKDCLDAFKDEFEIVLQQMEEYEDRIDRLTAVVTSAISIVDSRRAERLTFLAAVFLPLSLVATLFAMSDNIEKIKYTFGYWAAASFALLLILLLWAYRSRLMR